MPECRDRRSVLIGWLIVNSVVLYSCSSVRNSYIRTPSMLAPQGPVAASIAGLSWFMIILGSLIFIGVMIYFMYAAGRAWSAARSNYTFRSPCRWPMAAVIACCIRCRVYDG